MADGIAITPGTGATVATDDAGAAGHVQIQKLAISADGSATPIPADATYGLDVDVTRVGTVGVIDLGTRDALAVGIVDSAGDQVVFSVPSEATAAPTIGTGACVTLDSLHTTIMTFNTMARANGGTGRILGARLVLKHDTFTGIIHLHVFRKSVTGTTAQDTLAVSDADKLEMVGSLKFDFSTAPALGGGRVQTADRGNLPMDYKCDAAVDDLYGILQLTSADTPTFAAADLVPFLSYVAD